MRPGQTITDGGSVVGIVKSVDGAGNVTLQASAAVAVAAGDTLGILPQVGDSQTPALQDAANVKTILSQYETSQYETQEGQEVPGMTDALYFTRTAPAITSITQLMSDTTLLNVVTTNLGLSETYGELPYDQQVTLLTSKVNLSTFSNPTSLQHYVEQFLALTGGERRKRRQRAGSGFHPALRRRQLQRRQRSRRRPDGRTLPGQQRHQQQRAGRYPRRPVRLEKDAFALAHASFSSSLF